VPLSPIPAPMAAANHTDSKGSVVFTTWLASRSRAALGSGEPSYEVVEAGNCPLRASPVGKPLYTSAVAK